MEGAMNTTLRGAVLGGPRRPWAWDLCDVGPSNGERRYRVDGRRGRHPSFPGAENGVYMPAILGSLCKAGSGNQCPVVPFSGAAGVLTPNNPQPLDASVAAAADRLVQQIRQTRQEDRRRLFGWSACRRRSRAASPRIRTGRRPISFR